MSDQAHEWTDEQIANLSTKIRETYEQAAREMEQKLGTWLSDYDRERKVMEERMRQGYITYTDYKKWLEDMAMERSWQQAMIDSLTNDAVNADVMCRQLINDELPTIFAENANFGAYDVDIKIGYDTGFTLVDRDTVMRLIKDNPELLPTPDVDKAKDTRWNRSKFASAVTQGVLQGESVPRMAQRLGTVFGMDERASVRAARTSFTSAENAGRINSYERAKRLGIRMQQEWLATLDMRTRHTHRLLDGQRVPVGGYFEPDGYGEKYRVRFPADPQGLPEMVWNCFVGDTLVTTDSGIEASYMHKYVGDLVTIDTSTGVHFTCTPNHPILTTRGWIAAAELNKGDDLLVTGRKNGERTFGKPDINHAFASIETVHEFAKVFFANRASVAGVDFHGDVATSNVEIIAKKRLLGFGFNPSVYKGIVKLLLKSSDSLDLCDGTSMERFGRVMPSTSGLIRSLGIFLSLFFGHGSHTDVHRFRATSDGYASIEEYSIDDLPATTIIRSELLDGLVGKVFVDHVVSVNVSSTSGTHVYNLQTGDGYYFVNEKNNGNFIIAKNCRCTLVAAVAGVDTSDAERWSKLPEGMTYDDWKGAKKGDEGSKKESGERQSKPTSVNGKNLIGTWQRDKDRFNEAIYDVVEAQGFNGKPTVVNKSEFERYAKDADMVMVRGYMAPDDETLKRYARELRYGEWYIDAGIGGAVHGQGMYTFLEEGRTAPSEETLEKVKAFSGVQGIQSGKVELMTVIDDFKSIDETEIVSKFQESALDSIHNRYGDDIWKVVRWGTGNAVPDDSYGEVSQRVYANNVNEYSSAMQEYINASRLYGLDNGSAAALMGYDGVRVKVDSGTYYMVVLNRTKLVILE